MTINSVSTGNPTPLDTRPVAADASPTTQPDGVPTQALAADAGKPQKPLDQVSDELKSVVLQTQDVAIADAASNELLTQLFQTLVDLLAKTPAPKTKLDV